MDWGPIEEIERDSDGQPPSYAWPGSYPILYVDGNSETLCPACATSELDEEIIDKEDETE